MGRKRLIDLGILCGMAFVLAMVIRWPVSLYVEAIQLDPNSPLHALLGREMTQGGNPFWVPGVEYPNGIPVRLIAWPMLLISIPLNMLFSAIPAMNIALIIRVFLQGLGVGLLARAAGWSLSGQLVAAAGVMLAPPAILALGNGQFENVVYLELALATWAGLKGGRNGAIVAALAMLSASFSSPYQGLVCAVVLLSVSVMQDRWRAAWMMGITILSWVPVYLYFSAVSRGQLHLNVSPAPGFKPEAAGLLDLFLPQEHQPVIRQNLLPGVLERIEQITTIPLTYPYGFHWYWDEVSMASYLGLGLVSMGAYGLWIRRKEPIIRGVVLAAGLCLVMSLGGRLLLSSWMPTNIPLPWKISEYLPGINSMQATSRFLSGVSFALALGAGALLNQRKWFWSIPVVLLFCFDGLLMAPARWPLQAAAPSMKELTPHLSSRPVAVWPSAPSIAPHNINMFCLAINRPVAMFTGEAIQEDSHEGNRRAPTYERNRLGETDEEWLSRIVDNGVEQLIEFEQIPKPLQHDMKLPNMLQTENYWIYSIP